MISFAATRASLITAVFATAITGASLSVAKADATQRCTNLSVGSSYSLAEPKTSCAMAGGRVWKSTAPSAPLTVQVLNSRGQPTGKTKKVETATWVQCICYEGSATNTQCRIAQYFPSVEVGKVPSNCEPLAGVLDFSFLNRTEPQPKQFAAGSAEEAEEYLLSLTPVERERFLELLTKGKTGQTITENGKLLEVSKVDGKTYVTDGETIREISESPEPKDNSSKDSVVGSINKGGPNSVGLAAKSLAAKLKEASDKKQSEELEKTVVGETDKGAEKELTYGAVKRRLEEDSKKLDESKADMDKCSFSNRFSEEYKNNCQKTKKTVETAQITNKVMQLGGSMAVNTAGSQAQQNAQQSGTYSSAVQGMGSTQSLGGYTQVITGGVNLMFGYMQGKRVKPHNSGVNTLVDVKEENLDWKERRKAEKLTGKLVGSNATQTAATDVANYARNDRDLKFVQRKSAFRERQEANTKKSRAETRWKRAQSLGSQFTEHDLAKREYETVTEEDKYLTIDEQILDKGRVNMIKRRNLARDEQEGYRQMASAGSLESYISGAQQLGMGILNVKQGNAAKKLADQMQNQANNNGIGIAIPGDQGPPNPYDLGDDGSSSAATDETTDSPVSDPLSDLANAPPAPMDGNPFGNAPPAGGFNSGNPGGGAGGGAGGGLGGGGGATSAARNEDEGGARPLDSRSDKDTRFSGSGGSTYGSGGGGGGGDQGPDLSGMLAALLPKEMEPDGAGHNIMEFRMPASERDASTPLIPQDYSIFKHISETYGRLHKEKRVVGKEG